MKFCSIGGCERGYFSKGLCEKHYSSAYRAIPENKARKNAREKIRTNIPENRAKINARQNARNAIPENRTKNRDRRNASRSTPEGKAKYNAYTNARNAIPENRAKKNAHEKARYALPEVRAKKNANLSCRLATNPLLRFSRNIRSLIFMSFLNGGFSKDTRTAHLLGCDFETAYKSIGWFKGCEIHHIIPLHTANTKEDIERLNHYTNLIALTVEEHDAIHGGRFELISLRRMISGKAL